MQEKRWQQRIFKSRAVMSDNEILLRSQAKETVDDKTGKSDHTEPFLVS